ncbi:HSP20 family protein [Anaerobranca californiensis DSM 14826]|jgi:HSP20 family protein|uniref:HSP20 family protein n=1 Tax=Anaerobranca californiensis DSM 14826 TaxID=1120989 RepID=A0A1M6P540_9FIRM|nr:Hsp20/alpha crystallin family protein [Anaerobranca californiensis]SHK03012.1 HSP20 family protein [Anaerobranca californiensis DSM 14826]
MSKAIVRRKVKVHEDLDFFPTFEPDVDLVESKDYLRLLADMPGFDREDMDVLVGDDTIIIRGERKAEGIYNHGEEFRILERKMGKVYREIPITTRIRTDGIQLYYEDGVLVVHLPKEEVIH